MKQVRPKNLKSVSLLSYREVLTPRQGKQERAEPGAVWGADQRAETAPQDSKETSQYLKCFPSFCTCELQPISIFPCMYTLHEYIELKKFSHVGLRTVWGNGSVTDYLRQTWPQNHQIGGHCRAAGSGQHADSTTDSAKLWEELWS